MQDLISRQAAIDLWEKYHPTIAVDAMQYDAELRQVTSADRPQGEWVDDGGIEKCNQCGERKEFPHWNFCPNCGARMNEGKEE